MSDEQSELHRRLEQATARHAAADDEPMDPETAALRAGWLALGDLLEAAQPQIGPVVERLPLPPARRRKRWLPLAIAALAASVIVALASSWLASGTKPPAVSPAPAPEIAKTNHPAPAVSSVPAVSPPPVPVIVEKSPTPAVSPVHQSPALSPDADLAWDNSLDEDIELAGRAILQARQDQLASTAAPGRVQYQLENLKKNIEDNSL